MDLYGITSHLLRVGGGVWGVAGEGGGDKGEQEKELRLFKC